MSSPQTTAQNSRQHRATGFGVSNVVGRSTADRRSHLRAVPDRTFRTAAPVLACEDNCHYCQGPETD